MDEQNFKNKQPRTLKSRRRKFTPYKDKCKTNMNRSRESSKKSLSHFLKEKTKYIERKYSIISEINKITGPDSIIEGFEHFMSTLSFKDCARKQGDGNLIYKNNLALKIFPIKIKSEMVKTVVEDDAERASFQTEKDPNLSKENHNEEDPILRMQTGNEPIEQLLDNISEIPIDVTAADVSQQSPVLVTDDEECDSFQTEKDPNLSKENHNDNEPIEQLLDNISEIPIDVTAADVSQQSPVLKVSFIEVELFTSSFQNDQPEIEKIDNMEKRSSTCSSTPIKNDEDKTCRTNTYDNYSNNTVDTNLINVGNIYDFNISNQIIMNPETTEKKMKILDESMLVYDEDGQLNKKPPAMIEYIQSNDNQTVDNGDECATVQTMDLNNEILVERSINLIGHLTDNEDREQSKLTSLKQPSKNKNVPKKSCFISDSNDKENVDPNFQTNTKIKKKVSFKKHEKSKKSKKTNLSIERDILIQSILESKKSIVPDTVEKCYSPEISIIPVDQNKKNDSQEIKQITNNKSRPILNCKCSHDIKIVARKIYQNILRQIKRRRIIRLKVAKRRRVRVQDRGTNTTNSSELVRVVNNGTNTSIEIPSNIISDPIPPIRFSVIETFDDKETNVELTEPIISSENKMMCVDLKTNLIAEILAKANLKSNNNLTKIKKIKPKKLRKSLRKNRKNVIDKKRSKSKSPKLHLNNNSSSSSENETREQTVTAQIHSIPRFTNRLSEDYIESDNDINSMIKPISKKSKKAKIVEKNRQDSEDFMHDSVLSNTFYLAHPTLSDQANTNVKDKNDHQIQISEELISDVSPDLARCAPEPTVLNELFHIKVKPGSKKSKKQPKIDEIYPVKQTNLVSAAKKIELQDFSHQIHRNLYTFNTPCSSSSFECNELSQPYKLKELSMFPQLDELKLNESEIIPPSNIEVPKYTKLKINARKRKKIGKKKLFNKGNSIDYKNENEENSRKRAVCDKKMQVDNNENIVIDNNSVKHTEEILKKNTQLINKNAAHRKRKELLKRQSLTEIVHKSFRQRTYNANDLDKTMYSMQSSDNSSLESLPYNQANESFYCNDADDQIISSTQFVDSINNRDFVSVSNIISPITYI